MDDVVVAYKRVGETYEGEIFLRSEETRSTGMPFEGKGYSWMMSRFAERLKDHPSYGAVMDVLSGQRFIRHRLDSRAVELLRTDPAAAISSMSHEPRTVIVRDEPAANASVKVELKVGHDTLADAFGDNVYLRLKDDKIECPFDGRWKQYELEEYGGATGFVRYETVELGDISILPRYENAHWATVCTSRLKWLGEQRGAQRYYLPRAWNESGGWISHADLEKKYNEYIKEKENVSTDR